MLVQPRVPAPTDDLSFCRDLIRAGQINRALRLLEHAPVPEDQPEHAVVVLGLLLDCRLARGDLGGAVRAAELLRAFAGRGGTVGAVAQFALGELATARGDAEAAADRYAAAGERLAAVPRAPDDVPWRAGVALALTRQGRHREGHALALENLSLARSGGSAYDVAHALRTLAATTAGDERLTLLRDARATLAKVTAARLAAQIDADLAVPLSLRGTPESVSEAVVLLRGAEDYAAREDLFPLQDRVRRQLERLGERPHRIRGETLAALTHTEQKAARLAADGLTNREIAATLRVTVKAVEWHLSHVYRKLGISSRAGLAESLGTLSAPV